MDETNAECYLDTVNYPLIYITDHVILTWSANISTVFIVKRREQKLNKSSKLGPSKSMTRTL